MLYQCIVTVTGLIALTTMGSRVSWQPYALHFIRLAYQLDHSQKSQVAAVCTYTYVYCLVISDLIAVSLLRDCLQCREITVCYN